MAVPIVDPPRVRPAGSLDLLREDVAALRSFRPVAGAGTWFEREAVKVLRRATTLLDDGQLNDRDRILLFERDGELMAAAVLGRETDSIMHVGFVGIAHDLHGARIDSEEGDRLSDAVVASCLDEVARLGFTSASALVARAHGRSRAMVERAGFRAVSRYDHDYDLYVVRT